MDEKTIEHEEVNESEIGKFSDTGKKEIKETLTKEHIDLHITTTLPEKGIDILTGEQVMLTLNEDIHIPKNHFGTITATANMARVGAEVTATMGKLLPEHNKDVVVEIYNTSKSPIYIAPGMKVAQLMLHKASS